MKYFNGFGAIVFLLVALASTAAANETYQIDPAHSSIGFHLGHMMGKVVGKFTKFEGKIGSDREHPQQSSVTVRIQIDSIDTGIAKRDTHLRSEEFFDVAKYPEITFKSRRVKQTGAQSGDILGDLTMHGVTKPITLHVKLVTPLKDSTGHSRWEVTADPIKRRDFGLMFSSTLEAVSMIGQDVTPAIEIEAVREDSSAQ
jgi:polyisoprenoid-binding protein YceI